jgi:hypothetical protein
MCTVPCVAFGLDLDIPSLPANKSTYKDPAVGLEAFSIYWYLFADSGFGIAGLSQRRKRLRCQ